MAEGKTRQEHTKGLVSFLFPVEKKAAEYAARAGSSPHVPKRPRRLAFLAKGFASDQGGS